MRDAPKCRECGRIITFIKTKKGKNMPVDSFSVSVMPYEKGALYYKDNGEAVRGYLCDKGTQGAVTAHEPHWYTCPHAKDIRRTGKTRQQKEDELRERILKEREATAKREAERIKKEQARKARIEAELAQTSMFRNREEVYR